MDAEIDPTLQQLATTVAGAGTSLSGRSGGWELTSTATLSGYAARALRLDEDPPAGWPAGRPFDDEDRVEVLLRTAWTTDTGEGWSGDYDPADPDDDLLLRFDVTVAAPGTDPDDPDDPQRWLPVSDASYCTQTPAAVPDAAQVRLLAAVHDRVADALGESSLKRAAQEASWVGPDWLPEPLRADAAAAVAAERSTRRS